MTIFTYLKEDHREILDLLETIEQMGPEQSKERDDTFNRLKKKLILHSKAEERAFYGPLMQSERTRDEVEHGVEEHQEAETLLQQLTDASLVGAAWFQKFKSLKQDVEHHIREEEKQLFADAKAEIDGRESSAMERFMRVAKRDEKEQRSFKNRDVA